MPDDRTIGVDDPALDDAALEALAEAHAEAPPAELRRRVLAAAGADRDRARARRTLARWRAVGAVAATVALALAGLVGVAARDARTRAAELAALARQNDALGSRLAAQEQTVAGLRDALAAQASVLRVLGGPRTLSASLAPPRGVGAGSGRVVVDPASGEAAIVVAGLPPLPSDQTYELWAIRGEAPPEPAGLFAVPGDRPSAAKGSRIERPGEVTAFAVSIEPAAGSRAPTGAIVLAGPVATS